MEFGVQTFPTDYAILVTELGKAASTSTRAPRIRFLES